MGHWCNIINSSRLIQPVCLLVWTRFPVWPIACLLGIVPCHGPEWTGVGMQRGSKGLRRCVHGETHDTVAHTSAIRLIASDRKRAKRGSDGDFHCTAPLAICPIYAFSTHVNTQQSACVCACVWLRSWACMKMLQQKTGVGGVEIWQWHGLWCCLHWFATTDETACALIEIMLTHLPGSAAPDRVLGGPRPGPAILLIRLVFWQTSLGDRV